MEINRERLKQDIIVTKELLENSYSRSDILYNYNYYYSLVKLLFMDEDYIDSTYLLSKNVEDRCKRICECVNSTNKFINYMEGNREELLELCETGIRIEDDIEYYKYRFYDIYRKYSSKDIKDIVLSFFSQYDENIYRIVKKYFDEEKIETQLGIKYFSGYTMMSPYTSSAYIISNGNNYDSALASSMAHELGHVIDIEKFDFAQKKKKDNFTDLLTEIPSTSFEIAFDNYLINQRIDLNGGLLLHNNRESFILNGCNQLYCPLSQDKRAYTSDGNMVVQDYFGPGNIGVFKVRSNLLYILGYYFAYHLSLIEKEDKKEFIKILNNISTTRCECSSISDSIAKSGFDKKEFLSGNLIEDDIASINMQLKRKYN